METSDLSWMDDLSVFSECGEEDLPSLDDDVDRVEREKKYSNNFEMSVVRETRCHALVDMMIKTPWIPCHVTTSGMACQICGMNSNVGAQVGKYEIRKSVDGFIYILESMDKEGGNLLDALNVYEAYICRKCVDEMARKLTSYHISLYEIKKKY